MIFPYKTMNTASHTEHKKTVETTVEPPLSPPSKGWFGRLMQSPHAFTATVIVAFCESSFFPLPPDIGMVSIILNDRSKAWRLAFWCSIASVLGGLLGYIIGAYLFDAIGHTIIDAYGLNDRFVSLKDDFHAYGFWLLILKGFTPIPYKLFTIASGVFHFSLWQFILASIIARAGRFFTLAAGLWYFGPLAKPYFERFFKWITFVIIILVILGFVLVKFI